METIALKSWIIRNVSDETVTVEEVSNGEPTGQTEEFARRLLPQDIRRGDRFRVVAQLKRAERERDEGFPSSVLAEATQALADAGGGG